MSGSVGTPALVVLQTRGIAHTVHSYEIVEPTGVETHRGERAAYGPAAAAALGSGVVVAAASYTALGLLGAALIGLPVWAMVRGRTALRRVSSAEVSVPEVPLD